MGLLKKDDVEPFISDYQPQATSSTATATYETPPARRENIVLGLVGAFLGSLLGVVAIVILGQLGYIASISGIIMGVSTLTGYEKFSKGSSVIGLILSSIICVGMVFVAYNIDYVVAIMRQFSDVGLTAPEAYEALQLELRLSHEYKSNFNSGLLMLYLFTALGLVPIIFQKIKERVASRR